MEELLERMEALSTAWREQFENPPHIPLVWSIEDGILLLDGVWICPVEVIAPDGEGYDVELLTLPLQDGYLDIYIHCPACGAPRLEKVVHNLMGWSLHIPETESREEFNRTFYTSEVEGADFT